MPLKSRRTVLLAKVETTYGVDSVPTGAANAILVRSVTLTPMETKAADRTLVRPYYGSFEQLPGTVNAMLECEVEMSGSGALGTVPAYGALLKGCAFAETITAGISVVYSPISAADQSLTIYYHLDGVLHKMLGARGSVSVKLAAGDIPVYSFKFTGLYSAVTDVPLPTATLTGFIKPVPTNSTNTTAFSLHGYAGVLQSLDIDVANQVVYRALVGTESVIITDRQAVGNVSLEAATIATKDWFTTVRNATTGALTVTQGTVAGNKVRIDAPAVQLITPKYADTDGIMHIQMGMRLVPGTAGNDELTFTIL